MCRPNSYRVVHEPGGSRVTTASFAQGMSASARTQTEAGQRPKRIIHNFNAGPGHPLAQRAIPRRFMS